MGCTHSSSFDRVRVRVDFMRCWCGVVPCCTYVGSRKLAGDLLAGERAILIEAGKDPRKRTSLFFLFTIKLSIE